MAIMAVSLMLLASCGQIKELVGINKSSEGSETIGGKLPTPAADKTFWDNWGTTIGVGTVISATVITFFTLWCKGSCCFDKTGHTG